MKKDSDKPKVEKSEWVKKFNDWKTKLDNQKRSGFTFEKLKKEIQKLHAKGMSYGKVKEELKVVTRSPPAS